MNLHLDENIAVDTACLISRIDKTDFAVVKKKNLKEWKTLKKEPSEIFKAKTLFDSSAFNAFNAILSDLKINLKKKIIQL